MTLLQTGFELAPTGTAIPTTGANGGDPFNGGVTEPGTSFVSDSSVAAAVAAGTYAGKIVIGSVSGECYRTWNWTGGVVHFRTYLYLTSYPGSSTTTLMENHAAGGRVSRIRIKTNGQVGLAEDSTGATTYTSGVLGLNTLYRLEASFDHVAGTMSLDVYQGNATSPAAGGSIALTGVAFPATAIASVRFGVVNGSTNNYTARYDGLALSDTGRVGPIVAGGTVTGVTATVSVQANAGTVGAIVGTTVTIAGVTAQVVVQGGERPIPPAPPSQVGVWPPDPYRAAIRSGGYSLVYSISATLAGSPVAGAQDLRPVGGSITDTTQPGVRRVLSVELAHEPGLFDLLVPYGTRLAVTAQVTYLNRAVQAIPMGVFGIDSQNLSETAGSLSLTAPDKWQDVRRARFIGPQSSTPGIMVVDQIAALIRGALGSAETVTVSATSTATVGALTWEKDRDKAILDLAESIGAWVYFDRDGVCVIADVPTAGASADWLVDASASGVLVELDRERSRADAVNVIVVESSAAEGPLFPTQYVWDDDPASPTYAGTDPRYYPQTAGPFGIVVDYFDSPILSDVTEARRAGLTILSRRSGLSSRVSLGQLQNPALDAGAVLDVLPNKQRYDIPRAIERHVADSVTHPLVGGMTKAEGRSVRTQTVGGGFSPD